jgi:hypothetical protein
VHVDQVVLAVPVAAPDAFQERPAAEDHAGPLREGLQQVELQAGQLHRPALETDLAGGRVNHEFAEAAHRPGRSVPGGGGSGPAEHRADPGDELAGGERLGQVVVGADPRADQLVDLLGAGGQHHDVGVAEGPDPPAGLDAVHPRQHEVQHDHLRLPRLGQLDALLAVVGGLDLEAVAFQVASDQADQRRLVVDHQRADRRGRLPAGLLSRSGWWPACGRPAARRCRA